MKSISRFIVALVIQLFCAISANAIVLANEQLLTPLTPGSNKFLTIDLLSVDPQKPVWVVYQLVAVSAVAHPEGEVALDSSFEMVPLPMGDSVVVFKTRKLEVTKATKGLNDALMAKVGNRKPEELKEIFGPEMYAAYDAIGKNEGSYLTGSIIKEYQTEGNPSLRLLTSVTRANGIQPVLIKVIAGQGEIPAEYESFGSKPLSKEKLIAALISFAIAGVWLLRRRK